MKITILQLKKGQEHSYDFMDYDFALGHGFNVLDYEKVYEYEKTNNIWLDDNDNLEEIFTLFNINRPDDFKGHSLSVSDIVILDNRIYYTDSFGFKRII